jgi:beta-glucanase (GH16 family)
VVGNGTLKVINDRASGYRDSISVQSGPEWGGDPGTPPKYDFMFGYAEARIKFTGGRGSWPAFWLSSSAHAKHAGGCPEPDLNFELDIMEYQGDEPSTFYGSEHRNTNSYCGVSDATRPNIWPTIPNLANTWHTFSVLWTASQINWYVDGVQVLSAVPFDSADQRMFILLTMQSCGWDSSNSCDSSTADNLVTEVDWVRVWQK